MTQQIQTQAFTFEKNKSYLQFNSNCRLFSTKDIELAQTMLIYLERNHVSSIFLDISLTCFLDSNCELLIYRISQFFAKDQQKNMIVKSNDCATAQNRVVRTLLRFNPDAHIEFVLQ